MISCALVFPPQRHFEMNHALAQRVIRDWLLGLFDNNAWREDGNILLWVADWLQSVERLTAEREVVGSSFPEAGLLIRVLKKLRNEGIPFALQAVGPSCGSDDHVKWRSCLQ